jgi:hypothetical protein
MSIYLKSDAVGLDKIINRMITSLNIHLNTDRSLGLDIYHRVYKEERDGKFIPFAFISGSDYQEVFVNDKVNGEVGFLVSEDREIKGTNVIVPVTILFSVNLDSIDNSSTQREDEKVIAIVQNAVSNLNWEMTGIKTGLKNVYEGFDTERIKYRDMQPFLNFSFTVKVIYKNICDYDLF